MVEGVVTGVKPYLLLVQVELAGASRSNLSKWFSVLFDGLI